VLCNISPMQKVAHKDSAKSRKTIKRFKLILREENLIYFTSKSGMKTMQCNLKQIKMLDPNMERFKSANSASFRR